MTRIRYLKPSGVLQPGDTEDVTNEYARILIARRTAEPASDEGDAGESVGPIAASDPSDADAHAEKIETHMRTQPETTAKRTRSPR
jgi:hypothetical protein